MTVEAPHRQRRDTPGLRGVDLWLGYHGSPVVTAASLTLYAGRVTALVGPNGSGKSTLLRALARLHKPQEGSVLLDEDVCALALSPKDFARRVTLLTQGRPTPNGVSVRDVVGYGRHPHRRRWRGEDADGPAAVAWAMEMTGVDGMAERGIDELSGGELQRAWLAASLAQHTDVLLLDEPTTFLDLRYEVEILDLIRDLANDHDVAVGVVLHDLNQAAAIADHVALLDQGVIRASGPPPQVLTAELLTQTYGIEVDVSTDTKTQQLAMRPVGKHAHRPREAR